jgi:hypothetical protein
MGKESDQNVHVNIISSISKRLLYLRRYVLFSVADPNSLIPDPDHHLGLNTDRIQGFDDKKLGKN